MARKVFISILGITNYSETTYTADNKIILPTRFVQEASIKLYCEEWTQSDKFYILVTDLSYKNNWLDNGHKDKSGNVLKYIGLKRTIENLNLKPEIKDIRIKDGNSEEEIWEIFDTVYSLLNEEDELVVDITHSFRSLPMLLMVLINYSKFLKKIKVSHICYGNFESRDKENNTTPIINITSLSILQNWTSAANDFINFGSTDKIIELTNEKINPILSNTKGQDKTASNLRSFIKNIELIPQAILTNRGNYIYKDKNFDSANLSLQSISLDFIKPFKPIIDKIQNKIEDFGNNKGVFNGFESVRWCIDFNWLQQGYTILQETIISVVLEDEKLDYSNENYRNIVSSAFIIFIRKIPNNEWKGDALEHMQYTDQILKNKLLIKLAQTFSEITELRNDINHCGLKPNSTNPQTLKNKLKHLFDEVLIKIQ